MSFQQWLLVRLHPLGPGPSDFQQIRRLQRFRRLARHSRSPRSNLNNSSNSLRSCVCDLIQFAIQRILKPNIASAQSPPRGGGGVIWLFLFFGFFCLSNQRHHQKMGSYYPTAINYFQSASCFKGWTRFFFCFFLILSPVVKSLALL